MNIYITITCLSLHHTPSHVSTTCFYPLFQTYTMFVSMIHRHLSAAILSPLSTLSIPYLPVFPMFHLHHSSTSSTSPPPPTPPSTPPPLPSSPYPPPPISSSPYPPFEKASPAFSLKLSRMFANRDLRF